MVQIKQTHTSEKDSFGQYASDFAILNEADNDTSGTLEVRGNGTIDFHN